MIETVPDSVVDGLGVSSLLSVGEFDADDVLVRVRGTALQVPRVIANKNRSNCQLHLKLR